MGSIWNLGPGTWHNSGWRSKHNTRTQKGCKNKERIAYFYQRRRYTFPIHGSRGNSDIYPQFEKGLLFGVSTDLRLDNLVSFKHELYLKVNNLFPHSQKALESSFRHIPKSAGKIWHFPRFGGRPISLLLYQTGWLLWFSCTHCFPYCLL